MNHSLNQLDDCIFDYLALNADKPVSLAKIFNDIRSKTGHRCNELTDSNNHRQYFLSTCYSLDRHYTNIKKIYHNNRLYLLFQKDKKETNFDRSYYIDPLYDDNIWREDNNLINIVNYMCDNSMLDNFDNNYYSNLFAESDTLLHLLVRYNKYDELVNLLSHNNVDLNKKNAQGETPLDMAITTGNKKMIKLLINYWDEVPVKQLQRKPNIYKQNNQAIITTKPETNLTRYWKHLTNTVYFLGIWYIFLNLFYIYHFITA
ncbi:ankyrin repeat protein [Klosneuvirus KNV1]|uniref:Ankyrin repeat protein n=1 Tax=Klosneuvirus KNV1 TaxID=1977640 RepID=A0A1V0SJX5_9VIRU|nr:ankyrin repeat protein [Klosneuvirus KNV1]